eukprot:maker-scaffold740_size104176-snap-gene-0.22 protein:Tk09507 transcript:maker-scaffold740_size104176-snap-gene-0.22-mRNA-1 annotation:"PREDICTED: uncharacterized protein K02A2.6-like"
MGVVKTKRRARAAIWWLMINSDIDELVQRCPLCQPTRSSQPREPACMAKPPEFPFQDVAVDLFCLNGKGFLVYVDRINPIHLGPVINPIRLRADNGPQFRSGEFSSFLDEHPVKLSLTSPYNPRSNGLAESAV